MKELMKTNIYDVTDTIVVVGSCLQYMQPEGFEKIKKLGRETNDRLYRVYRRIE